MELELEHLMQINNLLVKKVGMQAQDPCFCGSVAIHKNCCAQNQNFWINDVYFEKLIGFAKHNNFFVKSIPSTFLKDFNNKFLNRFNICANPKCNNSAIGSHIFGESLVRKYFNNGKCQWYLINDDGIKTLCSVGISNDIKYPIFCNNCDNAIFRNIDKPDHGVTDTSNQLLHLFRCMSFQYQFTRTNLALAHQLAFGSVKIIFARQNHTGNFKKNEKINIDHLIMSFVGYKYHFQKLKELSEICIDNKTSNKLRLFTRVIDVKNPVFAQGVLNPRYDLNGKKIEFINDAGIIYVVLPNGSGNVCITVATLDDEYHEYIKQLDLINDYDLKKLVNGYIQPKNTQYNLLLSMEHMSHQKALR